VQELDYI